MRASFQHAWIVPDLHFSQWRVPLATEQRQSKPHLVLGAEVATTFKRRLSS